jgi:hypothetical protein
MTERRFVPVPPVRSKPNVSNLRLEFAPGKADQIRKAAARHGVSMRAFCQQAIDFALESMEPK